MDTYKLVANLTELCMYNIRIKMVDLSPIEIASTIRQTTSEYGKNFQKQLGGLRNDRNELRR